VVEVGAGRSEQDSERKKVNETPHRRMAMKIIIVLDSVAGLILKWRL
jgi:hypothetical protein